MLQSASMTAGCAQGAGTGTAGLAWRSEQCRRSIARRSATLRTTGTMLGEFLPSGTVVRNQAVYTLHGWLLPTIWQSGGSSIHDSSLSQRLSVVAVSGQSVSDVVGRRGAIVVRAHSSAAGTSTRP